MENRSADRLTPSEILALPPDELAAKAGELVMGWSVCRDPECDGCDHPVRQLPDGTWTVSRPDKIEERWSPADSADDDRMILPGVRKWDERRQLAFLDALIDVLASHSSWLPFTTFESVNLILNMEPGDYARASLIVVTAGGAK